jgi:hypothetical protein
VPQNLNPPIQGYLDRTYAVCGQTLGVHLATTTPMRVVIEAIRVGSYHGLTGRLVWRSAPVSIGLQPVLPHQPRVTQDNAWPTTTTLTPDAHWPPGLYVIRFHAVDRFVGDSYQPLYVQTSGEHAAYLAIGSDLTQLAYNKAGGSSLYQGPGATDAIARQTRAYIASTHRALEGSGINQLLTMDIPLAVILARHHLTADWTSDMSLDADPSQIVGHPAIIIPGHSEYWTRRNYDALEYAVGRGTNLAVLGANELYWQTRVRRDGDGNVASMTVYRSSIVDPETTADDKTVQWRSRPLNRDPASLTGLGMSGVGIHGDGTVVSTPGWLFHDTGLQVGMVLERLYGNEADGPADLHSPSNEQILIRAQATDNSNHHVLLATGYHSATSGAGVFNAGTTEWLCDIADLCATPSRTLEVRRALDQLTYNLLVAFAQPKAGLRYPSAPSG